MLPLGQERGQDHWYRLDAYESSIPLSKRKKMSRLWPMFFLVIVVRIAVVQVVAQRRKQFCFWREVKILNETRSNLRRGSDGPGKPFVSGRAI